MEKIIWVIDKNREELIDAQRKLNKSGSMRAQCVSSKDALLAIIERKKNIGESSHLSPSLILIDYDMEIENDDIIEIIKNDQEIASVPIFFLAKERTPELDEECFKKGAIVVISKPIKPSGILRIERMAHQYDDTKNYEKFVQKQSAELAAAKEIYRLNKQLQNRNEFLNHIFGKYFSDDVMEEILNNPEASSIGGRRKDISVMFCDLRGFSAISERISPEILTSILNYFYSHMETIIVEYKGTVIEFMGDGILAVFGAVTDVDNHRANAISAAIKMQNEMENINEYMKKCGYPILRMGIGLNSGVAFVGNVGSETLMRYNVIGSVVNETSRIESYSVGGQILASVSMINELSVECECTKTMSVSAKGFKNNLEITEIHKIGGDYNVSLNCLADTELVKLEESINVDISLINGKIVEEDTYSSYVSHMNSNYLKIALTDELRTHFQIYNDIKINGCSAFVDTYGKITHMDDKDMIVSITYKGDGIW